MAHLLTENWKDDWKKALQDQEIIVHLAAETGTGQSMYEIEKYNDVNIMGTTHLLQILMNSKQKIRLFKIYHLISLVVSLELKYSF